jgi:long-chain acyl-CoA synthetase
MTAVGPLTVRLSEPTPATDSHPSRSGIYRNKASAEELPTTYNGCSTLYELFNKSVEEHPNNKCLGWRPVKEDGSAGPYEFITFKETQARARQLAAALSKAGFKSKDKLGIYSANNVEWMLAIRACDVMGGVIVPIYDSLGESAVEYIVNHSELSVALVDTANLAKFAKAVPQFKTKVHTREWGGLLFLRMTLCHICWPSSRPRCTHMSGAYPCLCSSLALPCAASVCYPSSRPRCTCLSHWCRKPRPFTERGRWP